VTSCALIFKKPGSPTEAHTAGCSEGQVVRECYLQKRGKNVFQEWKKRYAVLSGDKLTYFKNKSDRDSWVDVLGEITMLTSTVKPLFLKDRYAFEVITPNKSYAFMVSSKEEMAGWFSDLQKSIMNALNNNISDKSKAKSDQCSKSALEMVREVSANCMCADCGAADADWASISLGIVICIQCSGKFTTCTMNT